MTDSIGAAAPAVRRRAGQGSERRARPLVIKMRVDAAEHAAIQVAANRAGLEVGSYLRARALEAGAGPGALPPRSVRRPPVERTEVARVLAALGPVASDLRAVRRALLHVAAWPGGGEAPPNQVALQAACNAVVELRAALMRALGRTP